VEPELVLMVPDRIRKLNLVKIINEFVNDATRSWCRSLLGVREVMKKVACTISDADPGAEDGCRAFFKRDGELE
jgi:hypothetical protein